jgi:hypothetical protein
MFKRLISSFLLLSLLVPQITLPCDIPSLTDRQKIEQPEQSESIVFPAGTCFITDGAIQVKQTQQVAQVIAPAVIMTAQLVTPLIAPALPYIAPVLPVMAVAWGIYKLFAPSPKQVVQATSAPTTFVAPITVSPYRQDHVKGYSEIQGGNWSSGQKNVFSDLGHLSRVFDAIDQEVLRNENTTSYNNTLDSYKNLLSKRLTVATTILEQEGKRPGYIDAAILNRAKTAHREFLEKNKGHINSDSINPYVRKVCGYEAGSEYGMVKGTPEVDILYRRAPAEEKKTSPSVKNAPLWQMTTTLQRNAESTQEEKLTGYDALPQPNTEKLHTGHGNSEPIKQQVVTGCGNANSVQPEKLKGYDIHPGPSKEDLHTGHNVDPVNNPLVLEANAQEAWDAIKDRSKEWDKEIQDQEQVVYSSDLGEKEAKNIFHDLNPTKEKEYNTPNGKVLVGTLDDGNTVIIRPKSSKKDIPNQKGNQDVAGLPTYEVQEKDSGGEVLFKKKARLKNTQQSTPEE